MFERMLEFQARQNPTGVAIWLNGAEITYAAMALNVGQLTTAFALENLPAGGVVLLDIANVALLWVVTLALERLGHPTVCATANEAFVALIQPLVVVTTRQDAPDDLVERTIVITDHWRDRAFSQSPSPRRTPAGPDDLIRIVLSSGTTGERKQIPLVRRVLDERARAAPTFTTPSGTRYLSMMGADTIGGLTRPLALWSAGGTLISAANTDEEMLRRSRPTTASMSPARFKIMLEPFSRVFQGGRRLSAAVSGSAMPEPLLREGLACEGLDLFITYGSTESGNTTYGPARLALERPGAVGYVTPWSEVEALGPDGEVLGAGQSGEIRIRSPSAVDGYRTSEATKMQFRDGWFHPNDQGRIDPDGVLVIDGRIDDVINVGGNKQSAARIEDVILDCRGVDDAAVVTFPMADGLWAVFAGLVSAAGYSSDEITSRVHARFGFNIRLVPLPKIERNGMGKIVRARVQAAILERQGWTDGVGSNPPRL